MNTSTPHDPHASQATPGSEDTLSTLWKALSDNPDAPCLISFDTEAPQHMPRQRLHEESGRLARGLLHHGLGKGERVAVFAANRPAWVVAAVAVLRAGLVLVPIDAQARGETLGHILSDSEPRLLLTDAKTQRRLREIEQADDAEIFGLDPEEGEAGWRALMDDGGDEPALPEVAPDDEAVLFYTSGTTGAPKGVPLSQRNLAFQLRVVRGIEIVETGDRMLMPLPLHHVYPFVIGMLVPLALNVPIILPRSLMGPELLRALREGNATILLGVPRLLKELGEGIVSRAAQAGRLRGAMVKALLRLCEELHGRFGWRAGKRLLAPLHRRVGRELRLLISGGSLLPEDVARRLEAMGWQVAIGYGLTETSPLLTINLPGREKLDTLGRPVEGIELRADPGARPSGDGDEGEYHEGEGELQARGPGVFAGYRHLEEKTRNSFTEDGFFRSGDMGWFDGEGEVHYTGRLSTMIVTEGGENIRPEAVEEQYAGAAEIAEIAVFERDGKLVGLVVPDFQAIPGSEAEEVEQAVRKAVERRAEQLPSYQRLSDLAVSSQAIPKTRLGKPRRHKVEALYDEAKEARETGGAKPQPVAVEDMEPEDQDLLDDPAVHDAWQFLAERYAEQPLSPDSRLQNDLGIDSLDWTNLTLEIQERTGTGLDETAIERVETVRDLLQEVAGGGGEARQEYDPFEHPEDALSDEQKAWMRPLSAGQRRLFAAGLFLHRLLMKAFFRVRAEGLERVPQDGPVVFTPNHLSYLDAPSLAAVLPGETVRRTRWAGNARVLQRSRWIAWPTRLAGAVPIRQGPGALAFGALTLRDGRPLIWFPEGRFSRDGSLQRLQPGLGLILAHQPATVVPVHLKNTERALPPDGFLPRPVAVRVRFGAPVDSGKLEAEGEGDEAADRIMDALRKRMEALR